MEIKADVEIDGNYSYILLSVLPDHEKYISCRRAGNSFLCSVRGNVRNVRKTLNEFLEALEFVEKLDIGDKG